MKVVLTALPLEDLGDPRATGHIRVCASYGLYLLAAVVMESGHEVEVIDPLHFEKAFGSREAIKQTLKGCDLLGLSVNSCTWPRAKKLLKELDSMDTRPKTVLGGPHPSLFDRHVLESSGVDYVIRGEGERPLAELTARLGEGKSAQGIPGISYRDGNGIVRNPMPPLLTSEELAELPLPRFELMPRGYYDLLPVETSRGCLHACLFCSVTYRRNWRGIPASSIAERLSALSRFLSATVKQGFFIIDDCFSADHARFQEVSSLLQGFPHSLVFEARIQDLVSKGVMDAAAKLPVQVIEMGVECGYQEGLDRVGKKISLDQVKEAASLLNAYGLSRKARFSFIMGLPWETKKQVMKTLEFAFKLAGKYSSRLAVNWLTVFPGSAIWHQRGKWGIDIEIEDYDRDRWWSELEVFKRTHPRLRWDQDIKDIATYIQMLKKLFPSIQHDSWLRYLPT